MLGKRDGAHSQCVSMVHLRKEKICLTSRKENEKKVLMINISLENENRVMVNRIHMCVVKFVLPVIIFPFIHYKEKKRGI